jgi:hypothetical protein
MYEYLKSMNQLAQLFTVVFAATSGNYGKEREKSPHSILRLMVSEA